MQAKKKPAFPLQIESEHFYGLRYELKSGHIVVLAGESGKFCVQLSNVVEFVQELLDITDVWLNVRT